MGIYFRDILLVRFSRGANFFLPQIIPQKRKNWKWSENGSKYARSSTKQNLNQLHCTSTQDLSYVYDECLMTFFYTCVTFSAIIHCV